MTEDFDVFKNIKTITPIQRREIVHYYIDTNKLNDIINLDYRFLDDNGTHWNVKMNIHDKKITGSTFTYKNLNLDISESESQEVISTLKEIGKVEISPSHNSAVTDNESLWIIETATETITIDEFLDIDGKLTTLHRCYFDLISKKCREFGIESILDTVNNRKKSDRTSEW